VSNGRHGLISPQVLARFVEAAAGEPIQGYTEEGERRKRLFLTDGQAVAHALAAALGLVRGTYDVRANPAGPAVGGDVHLHGEWLYVNFSQTALGPEWGFMYRRCSGRRDFRGEVNQWMPWRELLNIEAAAETIRCRLGVHEAPAAACRTHGGGE
jgi:hypothetical protein